MANLIGLVVIFLSIELVFYPIIWTLRTKKKPFLKSVKMKALLIGLIMYDILMFNRNSSLDGVID